MIRCNIVSNVIFFRIRFQSGKVPLLESFFKEGTQETMINIFIFVVVVVVIVVIITVCFALFVSDILNETLNDTG